VTRHEVAELLSLIVAYWPEFQHQGELTVNAWHVLLRDVPYPLAQQALLLLASTKTFPPKPAELLEAVAELTLPPEARLTPAEAWQLVVREVQRVGYYGQPDLPLLVRQAVDCLGWTEICRSENVEVTRAHFMRVFEQLVTRQRRQAVLPQPLRQALVLPQAALAFRALPVAREEQ
jgi:secreted PhoX family phosphatase